MRPAFRWGTKEGLDALLGDGVRSPLNEQRTNFAYFRSVDHAVAVFSSYFGPTVRALETIDAAERERFRDEIRTIFERYNRAADGTAKIETCYLQTLATCR